MNVWLRWACWIDALNRHVGRAMAWPILGAIAVSAGNAISRKLFDASSNAWLEVQWHLFALSWLGCAGYVLLVNEHVRVDLIYAHVSPRARLWIDVFGIICFLLPATIILTDMTWPFFWDSWVRNEDSNNAGGLLRWPVKLLLPVGFLFLTAQGVSELIKRFAALFGMIELETRYDRPLQ